MISPCIIVCTLDDKVCTACGRTTDEITVWRNVTEEQHKKILEDCVSRLDDDAYKHWVNMYNAKVKRLT